MESTGKETIVGGGQMNEDVFYRVFISTNEKARPPSVIAGSLVRLPSSMETTYVSRRLSWIDAQLAKWRLLSELQCRVSACRIEVLDRDSIRY